MFFDATSINRVRELCSVLKPLFIIVNIVMAVVSLACRLFLLLVAVTTPPSSQSVHTTYLIRPSTSTPCPPSTADRCLTLQQFAQEEEPDRNTTTDVTMEFMSGVHNLSTTIVMYNLENVTALPLPGSDVLVRCTTPASLYFNSISHLQISQLSIDSCGMGLRQGTVLVFATNQAQFSHITIVNSSGTAIFVYSSYLVLNSTVIEQCGFINANAGTGGAVKAYYSQLLIVGISVFSKNLARVGGAIFFGQGRFEFEILGNTTFTQNVAGLGGAVYIDRTQNVKIGQRVQFSKNRAILYGGALFSTMVTLLEYGGTYSNNTAQHGGAMLLVNTNTVAKSLTTISGNNADIAGGGIHINVLSTLTIQSNGFTVEKNTAPLGGGMYISNSSIFINATVKLVNNSAIEGGGCYLSDKSHFHLASEAKVLFSNNLASQRGGAIYSEVRRECKYFSHLGVACVFTVPNAIVKQYLQLWNNSARSAGDVLYGGQIDTCLSLFGYNIYNISNMVNDTTSLSEIASDPLSTCFCNNREIQCSALTIEVELYPGQTFKVPVVTVGQANGVVPSSVQAELGPNSQATMGAFQNSQHTKTACTSLTFTLYSKNYTETITLTTGKCILVQPNLKRYINVTLLQCPEGFELSGSPAQCICQERLQAYTKDCTIDDQKIHRTHSKKWGVPTLLWVLRSTFTLKGVCEHPRRAGEHPRDSSSQKVLYNTHNRCYSNTINFSTHTRTHARTHAHTHTLLHMYCVIVQCYSLPLSLPPSLPSSLPPSLAPSFPPSLQV